MISENIERIKKPVLLPFALILMVLLAGLLAGMVWLQDINFSNETRHRLHATQQLLQEMLDGEAEILSRLLDFYAKDEGLQHAYLVKDREGLLGKAAPLLEEAKTSSGVTHFYFIGLDNRAFLRVHRPGQYNDYVKHFTLAQTVRNNSRSSGIELGKFGNFTLRVVLPWRVDGELVGYLELGKEIEHITPRLKKILASDLFFLIDKPFIQQRQWEIGLEAKGRAGNWDELTRCVVVDRTLRELPQEACDFVQRSDGKTNSPLFKKTLYGRKYRGGLVPLRDAGGRNVGNIFVMHDFTKDVNSFLVLATLVGIFCFICGGMIWFLLSFYIGKMEKRLIEKYDSLNAEITKTSQHNELILNSAGEGIFGLDKEGRHTFVNSAAAKMLGYSQEELIGAHSHSLWHHTKRDGTSFPDEECPIYTTIKDGESRYGEDDIFWKKDGTGFSVSYTSTPILRAGLIIGAVVSFIDISENKKIREDLQRSEDMSRTITRAALNAIIMMDSEGVITYWNPAAERIFGYMREEAIGHELHPLLAPADYHESFRKGMKIFKKSGKGSAIGKVIEMTAIRKGGEEFPVELSLSAFQAAGTWNAVGIIRDITERKEADAERENLQAQLRRVQKMEAIATLAGGIAHDFNNILGAILGFTDLSLIEVPKGSAVQENLEQIRRAGQRAKDLVAHILTFSRQTETRRQPMNAIPIVKEAFKMLRATLPSTIEIKQKIEAESFKIKADPVQIHQILMSLCTNAADAMRDKGGTLTVSMSEIELKPNETKKYSDIDPGSYLKLTVSDTGSGMENEIVQRIFEPFFTTKEKGIGTGMGLSVVHGIVQSYNGCITVDSAPGKGSVFSVLIPLLKDETIEETEAVAAVTPPKGRGRVLLVDDDAALVTMGQRMLEYLGYEVVSCSGSVDALEVFKAQPDTFDLVITDQTMPTMTGMDLAQKIREVRNDMPIILCTGYSEMLTKEKVKAMGIDGYLMKPLSINELAVTCRDALGLTMTET